MGWGERQTWKWSDRLEAASSAAPVLFCAASSRPSPYRGVL